MGNVLGVEPYFDAALPAFNASNDRLGFLQSIGSGYESLFHTGLKPHNRDTSPKPAASLFAGQANGGILP